MSYAASKDWYANVPRNTRPYVLSGLSTLFLTVLVFVSWGFSAPIAGAIIASGVFVATGQNKIIQHLEGGVIREILVREGDIVEPDQLLILLDETTPKAELRRLSLRFARLSAIEKRLEAEMSNADHIDFPPELLARGARDEIGPILVSQQRTFAARRASTESDIASLNDSINALEERIKGSRTQHAAVERQLLVIQEELNDKSRLLKGGLIRKPELLALQRAQANLEGEIGRLLGEIGDARERVARTREQIVGVRNSVVKAAVEQMHEISGELTDLRERIRAAERVVERISITAPVRGAVVKLRYHTPGGVVEAGKAIMEIVPVDEELMIEARIRPQDIDNVRVGQVAEVRLTALSQRTTPMVAAEVAYVSADSMPNEKNPDRSNPDVYLARVRLDQQAAKAIREFEATPGMPAEVYIKTNERTFFEYLMRPIRDSMSRAFRES